MKLSLIHIFCATKAAFNQSEDWLNELNQYIQNNKDYAISFIQKEIKDVYVVPTEATYLLWIDCHEVGLDSVELTSFIRKKTGLYVNDGLEYGENGKAFIRIDVYKRQYTTYSNNYKNAFITNG